MKWTVWLAWALILLICVALPVLRALHPQKLEAEGSPAGLDVATRTLGRYIVGAKQFGPDFGATSVATMDEKSHSSELQRIATAIVAGEVQGADSAANRLKAIDTDTAREFLPIYEAHGSTAAASLEQERLGWFCDLAQSFGKPDADPLRARVLGQAKKTFVTIAAAAVGALGAGLVGLTLFIAAIVLAAMGKIRFAFLRPTGLSRTYIEAFAIYLVGILAVGLGISWAAPDAPLWLHMVGMSGPIVVAFYWPMIRGTRWKHQRRDWGIHTGRGLVIEALCGIGGYLAGLPIIVAGVLTTVVLLTKTGSTASHPIMQDLDMSPWLLLGMASVFAPLTEELLFRGALVSHLRGGVGAVTAAILSGLIFASIHPQGWAAIPALASIGLVLALIRQWRGSLVPSMVAHALHNGALLGVVLLVLH